MGRYLNLGNAGFASIRKGLYVDKSMLIDFVNSTLGTKEKLTCVSRPRRFGKSFATQMLCAYYDRSCDSGYLFRDLE
ncbi:MAG TPA: AAA family ATPase, partial [Candidatus Anaerobutyricum stercoripullorum]|nr:AAA family ATPase [Candidatus Anaerobutyricum stercoripullorum]